MAISTRTQTDFWANQIPYAKTTPQSFLSKLTKIILKDFRQDTFLQGLIIIDHFHISLPISGTYHRQKTTKQA